MTGVIGVLDQTTRLARVLVSVKDPLALRDRSKPKIFVNSIVRAEIEGKALENVFRIKREHLHTGNTIWLNKGDKLHISTVAVVFKDDEYAYISKGIRSWDSLVTTSLATIAPGIDLRTDKTPEAQGEE